jgi:tetratricopeptide (TPR) repeat protein
MTKRIFLFTSFLFFGLFVFSQNSQKLKQELQNTTNDSIRCYILNQLIEIETDQKAIRAHNARLKIICEDFLKTHKKSDPNRNYYLKNLGDAWGNLGFFSQATGNIAEALNYFNKSLAVQQEAGNQKGIANCYINFGFIYSNLGDVSKALDYYLDGLKIQEKINYKLGIANTLGNIAIIYYKQGDVEKSLSYLKMGLKYQKEINHKLGISYSLMNIGTTYGHMKNTKKALEYFMKSIAIAKEIKNDMLYGALLSNLGQIYEQQGELEKAFTHFSNSFKIAEEIEDKEGMTYALKHLAAIQLKQGLTTEAIRTGKKSLLIAEELGFPQSIEEISTVLSEIYTVAGDWKGAFEMQVLFKKMSDSIKSVSNRNSMLKKGLKYEFDKKVAQDSIKSVATKKIFEAQIKQERTQRISLYFGIGFFALFALFIYYRYRLSQEQKKIIQNQKGQIIESINYSKKIQDALLPELSEIKENFRNIFVYNAPKDIVSGDFYWCKKIDNTTILACVDCTGHGVPGAFMSTIGSLLMDKITQKDILSSSSILSDLSIEIIRLLHQEKGGKIQDGMDLSICILEHEKKQLSYSGARNGITLVSNGKAQRYKADLLPVGGSYLKKGKAIDRIFSTQIIDISEGDWIYMYTDGFFEQVGTDNIPMNYQQYENTLLAVSELEGTEQKIDYLQSELDEWRGNNERTDDVLIIGFQPI